jgi:hypothetical protein
MHGRKARSRHRAACPPTDDGRRPILRP